MREIYDLIIIGAGPCGIACAAEAKKAGIKRVLLLEKGTENCQTIRTYYKDGKRVDKEYRGFESENLGNFDFIPGDKENTLAFFCELIKQSDCELDFRHEVGRIAVGKDGVLEAHSSTHLFRAKKIIVAIGKMGKPNKPVYEIPYNIAANVNFNTAKCSSGEKILVVGGGNSAIEYALALSENNDVSISYRQDSFTRLNEQNLADITEAGKNGKVKLKMGNHIASLEKSENDDIKVTFRSGEVAYFDRLIYAIGGVLPVDFLHNSHIAVDDKNVPIIDENYQTNIKNLYLAGDLITKNGASIVVAMNDAYKIISHIAKAK